MGAKRPIEFSDLLEMRRAARPRVTADGRAVIFAATRPDREANANETHLYRVAVEGGEVTQLTRAGRANQHAAISPDGGRIAFTSNRSGTSQVWVMPTDGGEARRVTDLPLGASRPVWFPDGRRLLVVSAVCGDTGDLQEIARREEERKAEPGPRPRVIDSLMFRHWDSWTEGKIDHLFVVDVDVEADSDARDEGGAPRDLTPGPYPAPPLALGGDPDFAVSPDGSEVAFVSVREDDLARSTRQHLWVVPAAGGDPRKVNEAAWDGACLYPTYSPDGARIAYGAMRRAGYEADRIELLVLDRATGKTTEVCPGFDSSVGAPVWSPDGTQLIFAAEDRGRKRLYRVAASGGTPEPLTGADPETRSGPEPDLSGALDHSPVATPDGKTLVFVRQRATAPPEIYRVSAEGGRAKPLTALNRDVLDRLVMHDGEDFWFEGAKGARVHGILIKPPQFEEGSAGPGKKYPVIFLVHGGPQTAFGYDFHERWNTQLFASTGAVVVCINPRGSTGYGQEFVDAINGEWGGACYEDLMRGFDHVLDTLPYVDRDRTAAAGASFGGYMMNWIAGHTDRFRCLVCHDGIFNTEMMDYATDELWFTEWEFGGAPWESPEEYRKWSPHLHVESMKTPMLVIQGELDFRCPVSEGLNLFTALQRRGVPSRLLYLDDEGHWVLKPKNREAWYGEVLGWLRRYLEV